MATPCLSFHLIFLLSSFLILGARGVSIQVYRHSNFTGKLLSSLTLHSTIFIHILSFVNIDSKMIL